MLTRMSLGPPLYIYRDVFIYAGRYRIKTLLSSCPFMSKPDGTLKLSEHQLSPPFIHSPHHHLDPILIIIHSCYHPKPNHPSSAGLNEFSIHFLSLQGQTLAMTFPLISANGNGPYVLESLDADKLSPKSQQ